ncbi:hypothetical protein ACA877_003254 [Vibrio alginolyticus]|uniref:hypothetical protein n=1 Tax=Vibrio alginolyticus TaxID=663 RepID=UPI00215E9AF6|nr:hypothetical protein [Vibrio alginolyticus]MCS0183255.1 hypothetical protein [Vibrio alginolyticus]
MNILAYLIQFIVIALIFGALMVFGFSWLSVLVGIIVYLLIDWLFLKLFKQEDHCRKAFEWEVDQARKFYHNYRPYI